MLLLVLKLCFILFLGLFFLPILLPVLLVISMSLILLFPAWSVYMFGSLLLPEIIYKCPTKNFESTERSEERQVSLELDPSELPFDLSESEEDETNMDGTNRVCIDQESNPPTFPEIRGHKSFDELMSFWRRQVKEEQCKCQTPL